MQNLTFLELIDNFYHFKKHKVAESTYKSFKQRVTPLKIYFSTTPKLKPEQINQIVMAEYSIYLKRKGVGANAMIKHFQFVKEALGYYEKLNPKKRLEINKIQNPKGKKTNPRPLSKIEYENILNAKLPKCLEHIRDYFVFMAETGFHFSDGLNIKKYHLSNHGQITLIQKERGKTEIEAILPASKIAIELLEKHNYNFGIKRNADYNKALKIVAEMAGVRADLRASDARDTFADYWGNEKAKGLDDVAIMMGLSSTRELPKYYRVRQQRILKMASE